MFQSQAFSPLFSPHLGFPALISISRLWGQRVSIHGPLAIYSEGKEPVGFRLGLGPWFLLILVSFIFVPSFPRLMWMINSFLHFWRIFFWSNLNCRMEVQNLRYLLLQEMSQGSHRPSVPQQRPCFYYQLTSKVKRNIELQMGKLRHNQFQTTGHLQAIGWWFSSWAPNGSRWILWKLQLFLFLSRVTQNTFLSLADHLPLPRSHVAREREAHFWSSHESLVYRPFSKADVWRCWACGLSTCQITFQVITKGNM